MEFSKPITKLNKYVNLDMKNLTNWLNANKISLNVQKTELVRRQTVKLRLSLVENNSTPQVLLNILALE